MSTCVCCGERFTVTWCDMHGIAACVNCGLPYRIYHYDGEGDEKKRVNKPPEPAVTPVGLEVAKRYWAETKRRTFPGVFDFGISVGNRTYSGATREDAEAWNDWHDANKSTLPQSDPCS